MIELIDMCVEMQQRVINAHEESLKAARKTMHGADAALKIQEAMNEATKANMSAWTSWLSFWGLRK